MAGVFTEANIGDHHQLRCCRLDLLNGALHDAICRICSRAKLIFDRGDAKENNAPDPLFGDGSRLLGEGAERPLHLTWHRANRCRLRDRLAYKEWIDEVGGIEARLAHQATKRLTTS